MAVLELEAPETPPPVRRKVWRQPRLPTMAHYLAMLRSSWIVLVVLTLLGAACGVAYARTVPRMWQASASIELPDLPVYVDLTQKGPPPKRATIDTTGQLAFSEPVLQAIAKKNGITPEEASKALTVSAYPLSRVIIVTLTAETEELAVNGANAAGTALANQRKLILAGGADRAEARDLANELRKQNQKAVEKYGYTPVTLRVQQEIANINDNLQAYGNANARVVNKAAPGKPVPPHSEVYVTTGAVIGFMLGILWTWWRPRKRRNVDHLPGLSSGF